MGLGFVPFNMFKKENTADNSTSGLLKVGLYVFSFATLVIGAAATVKYAFGPWDEKKNNSPDEPEPPTFEPPTEPPVLEPPTFEPPMWLPEPPADWPIWAPWPPEPLDPDTTATLMHLNATDYSTYSTYDYSGFSTGESANTAFQEMLMSDAGIAFMVISVAALLTLAAKVYYSSSVSSTRLFYHSSAPLSGVSSFENKRQLCAPHW